MKTNFGKYPHVGDKIRFLDTVGGGVVSRIDEDKRLVYVLDDDGFELPVVPSQCVVISSDFAVQTASDTKGEVAVALVKHNAGITLDSVKTEENIVTKTMLRHRKTKPDILEIDLHIHQLLDSTLGMSNADMLRYQLKVVIETLQAHSAHKGQKIVFIHGKGAGVLRRELEKLLQRDYSRCDWQDASFREYGFGATMVTIR